MTGQIFEKMSSENAPRFRTRRIHLGNIPIGGGAPVSVQTMIKADTRDISTVVADIRELADAGCDIVRIAVPDMRAAEALKEIKRQSGSMPIVADIHFDWRLAIASLESGADGLRINPGNIGDTENVRKVALAAKERGAPIRIGVNAGSLETQLRERYGGATPEALVESALRHIELLENEGFRDIKVSVKASDISKTIASYRMLSEKTDCPLHLGLTEAGTLVAGTVKSSFAMGILLSEGIGDTIRVSLTDKPVNEVLVGMELLRCLGLKTPGPSVTSCPTCGRTQADVPGVARMMEAALEKYYRNNPNAARPHVAVMGCIVNGPGEAKDADIALVGGKNCFFLYVGGKRISRYSIEDAVDAAMEQVVRFGE